MKTKADAVKMVIRLKEAYPLAVCNLDYGKAWQLMVAVRLSAQCTDARVNKVTPALFERYPTAEALAEADLFDVECLIKSCGFYRHKARDIIAACQMLVEKHGGVLPQEMDALLAFPGVGRKSANLLLGDVYGAPGVVVADTHLIRIAGRLGLAKGKDPLKVEMALRKLLPPEESNDFCHRCVLHGRAVCTARTARCGACVLEGLCEKNGVKQNILTPRFADK